MMRNRGLVTMDHLQETAYCVNLIVTTTETLNTLA